MNLSETTGQGAATRVIE